MHTIACAASTAMGAIMLAIAGRWNLPMLWAYVGIMGGVLCSGLALGSWLSLLPGAVFALLLLWRTVVEDRFLHEHFDGYADYARQVPHRLVPGLW